MPWRRLRKALAGCCAEGEHSGRTPPPSHRHPLGFRGSPRVAVPWLLLAQAMQRGRWPGQRPSEGSRDVLVAAAPRGRGVESSWLSASLRGSTPHSPATFITQRAATCPAQTPAASGGHGAVPAEASELLSLCSSCLSGKSLCGQPRGAHLGTRAEEDGGGGLSCCTELGLENLPHKQLPCEKRGGLVHGEVMADWVQ